MPNLLLTGRRFVRDWVDSSLMRCRCRDPLLSRASDILETETNRRTVSRIGSALESPSGIVTLLCTSAIGTFLAQGLLYPALPLYLHQDLGTSLGIAGLIMASQSISAVIARPWAGHRLDAYGRKTFLIAGPLITAGTAVGLLTMRNIVAVLVLRLMQGVANAMFYGAATAMVADVAPPERRATFLARYSLFFYLGFATGPAVAELLITRSGFEAVWWTVIGASLFGALLALRLPETGTLNKNAEKLPMRTRLFHPAAIGPGIPYFCAGVGWTSIGAFLALYSRSIGMKSSGGLFAALSITVMVTRSLSGNLADRYGRRAVTIPCSLLCAVGLAVLALFQLPIAAFVAVILFAAGYAGLYPTMLAMVVDDAPANERGQAMGSFNMFFDIGAPLGGFLTGRLVDVSGYRAGFGAMAGIATIGSLLLISNVIGRRHATGQFGVTDPAPRPSPEGG